MKMRRSIRSQLVIVVMITTIPVLLLLIVATYTEVQEETRQARMTALNLAELTAATVEQSLVDSEAVLSRLAQRPMIRALDPQQCDPALVDLAGTLDQYSGLGLVNNQGDVICSVNAPDEGDRPSVADREWYQRVMRERQFTVGEVQVGRVTGRWVSVLAYPVLDPSGELGGAILAPIDLVRFQQTLNQVSLPPGSTITIIDSNGTVVARSIDAESWLGRNARGIEVTDLVLAQGSGQARAAGLDSIDRLYGFTLIPSANWYAYVGIPAAQALTPARVAILRYTVLSVALLALVGVVGWYFRGLIVDPLYAMADVARDVARGDLNRRAPVTGPRELAEVARQFNTMLTVRADHTAQLERQARELAMLAEMGQAVSSTLDIQVVLDRVLEELSSLVPAEGVSIILLEGNMLRLVAANGPGLSAAHDDVRLLEDSPQAEVIRNSATLLLEAEQCQPLFRSPADGGAYQTRSMLLVPLPLRGEVIGILEAVHSAPDAFAEHDLRLLKAAGTWTAIAIANARLYQEEFRAHKVADTLRAANVALSAVLERTVIAERILHYSRDLVPYDAATVLLRNDEGQWEVRATSPTTAPEPATPKVKATIEPERTRHLEQIIRTAEGVVVTNRQDGDGQSSKWNGPAVQSWIGVPLVAGDAVTGILTLQRTQAPAFNETDLRLMEALAAQASVALQNATLFEEIRSSREQLRGLTQQLVSAQENERKRLSQELHDDAGQMLTAIQINLGIIRGQIPAGMKEIDESIGEVVSLAAETMNRLRWLSQDLRPPALQHTSLLQAIEALCSDFGHRTDIDIRCEGEDLKDVPDDMSLSLYRFVQEALTNVAKHAEASKVHVQLHHVDHHVEATVSDNGRGFDVHKNLNASTQTGHFGLVGMKERLQLLGGTLKIDSTIGAGTTLTASVPLPPPQEAETEAQNVHNDPTVDTVS
jgi:signal transduction histidine kinase/HAMP domain-containing protein